MVITVSLHCECGCFAPRRALCKLLLVALCLSIFSGVTHRLNVFRLQLYSFVQRGSVDVKRPFPASCLCRVDFIQL